MTFWQAAALGVLQGLTEFLPVSSSGHLALAQMLIPGFSQPGVVFDAALHVGTAAAVVWFERQRIRGWVRSAAGRRLLILLVAGTLATAAVALPLRHAAEASFTDATVVGLCLMVTGAVLLATRAMRGGGAVDEVGTKMRQAIWIGLTQGLAVFPGLSRSGLTIAAGLGSGLDRAWAARFSFLLGVPAITAATLVHTYEERHLLAAVDGSFWVACVLGAAVAAVTGYVAIRFVIWAVSSEVFHRFAWYCIPLGLLVLVALREG